MLTWQWTSVTWRTPGRPRPSGAGSSHSQRCARPWQLMQALPLWHHLHASRYSPSAMTPFLCKLTSFGGYACAPVAHCNLGLDRRWAVGCNQGLNPVPSPVNVPMSRLLHRCQLNRTISLANSCCCCMLHAAERSVSKCSTAGGSYPGQTWRLHPQCSRGEPW